MKRVLAAVLALVLCLSPAAATGASTTSAAAQGLFQMGLFQGVGTRADGSVDFDLDRAPNRAEAVTMLVRALGGEAEAKTLGKAHPFTDVPAWADGYVSYAWKHELTRGVSATEFGSGSTVTCDTYLTFVLRALGYVDSETDGDFTWSAPYGLACRAGVFPTVVDYNHFTRRDVAEITAAALFAKRKDSETTLGDSLVKAKVFTEKKFSAAFPSDPYAREKQLETWAGEALNKEIGVGQLDRDTVRVQSHILTSWEESGGTVSVFAYVETLEITLLPETEGYFSSSTIGTGLYRLDFDAKTGNLLSMASGLAHQERSFTALDSPLHYDGRAKVAAMLRSGEAAYRLPTYDEAMEDLLNREGYGGITVEQRLEARECTVLSGVINGVPHSPCAVLKLVYKPNSALGEGKVIDLPTVAFNAWGSSNSPDTLELSGDKSALTYTYVFTQRMEIDPGTQAARVIHEAGTYRYTVDLATGQYTETLIPN